MAGRLLLLSAVATCWGGFVVPQLISLAFPELLPPSALPRYLDPGIEGTPANAIWAAALLAVAVLALANAISGPSRDQSWVLVAGWTILALATTYLAWDELSTDLHKETLAGLRRTVFGESLDVLAWTLHLGLLPAAFGLAVAGIAVRDRRNRAIVLPLSLGLAAWVLTTLVDLSRPAVFADHADQFEIVLDESLEFSGSLLIALSASVALGWHPKTQPAADLFPGRRLCHLAVGSVALVTVLGGLAAAFLFRAPVVDAQSISHVDRFRFSLGDQEAAVQELRMPAVPLGSVHIRAASRDPADRAGTVGVRLTRRGTSEPILAEGSAPAPARQVPAWVNITLHPKLVEPEGQPLALAVVADLSQDARLLVGATKRNRHVAGDLWINGQMTWPDQSLEFVAYGTNEPTRSKLAGLLTLLASGWRWPLLFVDVFIALTFITFVPLLLVSLALSRPSSPPQEADGPAASPALAAGE
ncbi:MAG: hypothetical protein F4X40_09940 [Chloroflexi bacterium]|nr:hypothetical protein [Chloroflexota bacterium]